MVKEGCSIAHFIQSIAPIQGHEYLCCPQLNIENIISIRDFLPHTFMFLLNSLQFISLFMHTATYILYFYC